MTNEIRSVNSGSYEIVFRLNLFSNDGKILTQDFLNDLYKAKDLIELFK